MKQHVYDRMENGKFVPNITEIWFPRRYRSIAPNAPPNAIAKRFIIFFQFGGIYWLILMRDDLFSMPYYGVYIMFDQQILFQVTLNKGKHDLFQALHN